MTDKEIMERLGIKELLYLDSAHMEMFGSSIGDGQMKDEFMEALGLMDENGKLNQKGHRFLVAMCDAFNKISPEFYSQWHNEALKIYEENWGKYGKFSRNWNAVDLNDPDTKALYDNDELFSKAVNAYKWTE